MSADQKTLDVYDKHISDYEKLIAKEFKDTNLDTFMKMKKCLNDIICIISRYVISDKI